MVVAVDGAVLQSDLVHAVSGGGGLCLMRLCAGLLLLYKNTSSLAATTLSSVTLTETHSDAVRTCSQVYVVESVQDGPGMRFWVARSVSWIEEVKRRGSPPLQRFRALSNFAPGAARYPALNARQGIGWGAASPLSPWWPGF